MRKMVSRCLTVVALFVIGAAGGVVAEGQLKAVLPSHGLEGAPVSADTVAVHGSTVQFVYKNLSNREVASVLFDAAYRDDAEQLHHVEVRGGYHKQVQPGEFRVGELEVRALRRLHPKEILLWPVLVTYKDGTVWEITGSR